MKKANNLSKFDKKALRLLFAVLFVPLFVSLVFIYELSVYNRSLELPADAQRIGSSDYYKIGGKIYLRSWNLAPYELEGGADGSPLSALKRAGDNPFKGAVRQISEKLLEDDAGFYYLNFYSHSVYVTGRSGRHLDKRTNFIELRKITLDVHDDEVMAQIADEAARNPEMSQPIFTAQDVEYENGAAFYMYCLAAVLLLGAWIYSYLKKRSLRRG